MKVIATKGGSFAPRDGEPFSLKPGDEVPASMADAALAQGWGKKTTERKAVVEKDTVEAQDD